jgi:hypothetical protein
MGNGIRHLGEDATIIHSSLLPFPFPTIQWNILSCPHFLNAPILMTNTNNRGGGNNVLDVGESRGAEKEIGTFFCLVSPAGPNGLKLQTERICGKEEEPFPLQSKRTSPPVS